tara:strand:- start:1292 stop:1696 length:405 start_codon:yes stop_codon:yes gene_type:complete
MKKILIIFVVLLMLPIATEARVWDSKGEERSLCVEGHGSYKFRGEGEALIENIVGGVLRFPIGADVNILSGSFSVLERSYYLEYIGNGDLEVEDFDGTISSKGRGSGDLSVNGVGKLYLGRGKKDSLEVDCIWE